MNCSKCKRPVLETVHLSGSYKVDYYYVVDRFEIVVRCVDCYRGDKEIL